MNRIIGKTGIFLAFIAIFGAGLISCRTEDPTIAIITVVDVNGEVIPNATVHLYPTPTINAHSQIVIDNETLSNESGQATFNYTDEYKLGQAGFAVLNVAVNLNNTLFGEGIIKVEAEKTSYETIVIQAQ